MASPGVTAIVCVGIVGATCWPGVDLLGVSVSPGMSSSRPISLIRAILRGGHDKFRLTSKMESRLLTPSIVQCAPNGDSTHCKLQV